MPLDMLFFQWCINGLYVAEIQINFYVVACFVVERCKQLGS
jgi:hypothetical protein